MSLTLVGERRAWAQRDGYAKRAELAAWRPPAPRVVVFSAGLARRGRRLRFVRQQMLMLSLKKA